MKRIATISAIALLALSGVCYGYGATNWYSGHGYGQGVYSGGGSSAAPVGTLYDFNGARLYDFSGTLLGGF